jgi:outer membrane protein TolC
MEKRAFWSLASLVDPSSDPGADPEKAYALRVEPEPVPDERFPSLDEAALVEIALANRPESRAAALAVAAARAGRKLADAPFYPTLSITGGYVLADPNSRVAFQSDPWKFTGTWSLGAVLSYDLGGIPANLAERDAQAAAGRKSGADDRRTRETIVLDLRYGLQAFLQARRDYALLSGMIDQAKEAERVAEQRLAAGTASELDLLTARLSRLKVEFSVTNKLIDEQIAAADLERAAALAKL